MTINLKKSLDIDMGDRWFNSSDPIYNDPDYYRLSFVIKQVFIYLLGRPISQAVKILELLLENSIASDYFVNYSSNSLSVKFALHGTGLYLCISCEYNNDK